MSRADTPGGPEPDPAVQGILHRPLRARSLVAVGALLLGSTFRWILDLPLDPAFFVVVVAWMAVATAAFRWLLPSSARDEFSLGRLLLFGFEVVVAVWVARFVSASSWPAILLVLLPAVEWNMLYPGWAGLAGSMGAVVGSGAVILSEALGFVPTASLLPAVSEQLSDPAYGLMAFLLVLGVVVGVSRVVGRYAQASRDKVREIEAVNRKLQALTEEVQASHEEAAEAYVELRRAQAELVSSARMATLGNLVRGVAHEINTPLGALASNHDVARRALERLQVILEDEVVDESELDEVRRIVRAVDGVQATNSMAVDRMKKLVRDLRTFGRPDRSEVDRVDVNEILKSALDLLQHEMGDAITVRKELGTLPPVECYPHKLSQVFMNLLLNAIQAMEGGGEITITTEVGTSAGPSTAGSVQKGPENGSRNGSVVIRIRDTGSGIPPENLERIFEPGFSTKGARVGMGLGLLISAQIIEKHGGRISVESEVGRGTVFTLVLPIRMPTDDRAPGTDRRPE